MKTDGKGNPARTDGTQKRQAIFAEFMKRSTVPLFEHESAPTTNESMDTTLEAIHGREQVDA